MVPTLDVVQPKKVAGRRKSGEFRKLVRNIDAETPEQLSPSIVARRILAGMGEEDPSQQRRNRMSTQVTSTRRKLRMAASETANDEQITKSDGFETLNAAIERLREDAKLTKKTAEVAQFKLEQALAKARELAEIINA